MSIRGIVSDVGAATVGVYIDDAPVQAREEAVTTNPYPKIFDLDRIEVLRGPQGTLFGAGSEGGTLRFITPEASLQHFSGTVNAEVATTDGGGPLSSVLRTSSTQVAEPSATGDSARPIRAARMRTCAIASSPEI